MHRSIFSKWLFLYFIRVKTGTKLIRLMLMLLIKVMKGLSIYITDFFKSREVYWGITVAPERREGPGRVALQLVIDTHCIPGTPGSHVLRQSAACKCWCGLRPSFHRQDERSPARTVCQAVGFWNAWVVRAMQHRKGAGRW